MSFESVQALEEERPDVSWLGIGLSASSLLVMLRAGDGLAGRRRGLPRQLLP